MNKRIISAFSLVLSALCCHCPAAAQELETNQNLSEPDTNKREEELDEGVKAGKPDTNRSVRASEKSSREPKASQRKPGGNWQREAEYDPKDDDRRKETLFLELGVGFGATAKDDFIERIELFGYRISEANLFRYYFAAGFTVLPYLCLMGQFSNLDDVQYGRAGEIGHVFRWSTHAAGIAVRGQFPSLTGFRLFAQVASGLAFSNTEFIRKDPDNSDEAMEESFLGFYLGGSMGLLLLFKKVAGFFIQFGMRYAPVIENELGDRRNGIGYVSMVGLRFSDRGL